MYSLLQFLIRVRTRIRANDVHDRSYKSLRLKREGERNSERESAKDPRRYINPNGLRGYKAHPAHILTRYYCRINNAIILPWRWKYEGSAEAATEAAFVATPCRRQRTSQQKRRILQNDTLLHRRG